MVAIKSLKIDFSDHLSKPMYRGAEMWNCRENERTPSSERDRGNHARSSGDMAYLWPGTRAFYTIPDTLQHPKSWIESSLTLFLFIEEKECRRNYRFSRRPRHRLKDALKFLISSLLTDHHKNSFIAKRFSLPHPQRCIPILLGACNNVMR